MQIRRMPSSSAAPLRVPSALLEHIQKDMRRVEQGRIRPGEIFTLHAPETGGGVWMWDICGHSLPTFPSSVADNPKTSSIIRVLQLIAVTRQERGVLMGPVSRFPINLPASRSAGLTRNWMHFELEQIPAPPFEDISFVGHSLRCYVHNCLAIPDWKALPQRPGGIIVLNENGTFSRPPVVLLYDQRITTLIHTSPPPIELQIAHIPLFYQRAREDDLSVLSLDYLLALADQDRVLQHAVVFGEKPRFHTMVIGKPDGTSYPIVVWRNILDGKDAADHMEDIRRYAHVLQRRGRYNRERWAALFRTAILGNIVEQVPLENAETGEAVTTLPI